MPRRRPDPDGGIGRVGGTSAAVPTRRVTGIAAEAVTSRSGAIAAEAISSRSGAIAAEGHHVAERRDRGGRR